MHRPLIAVAAIAALSCTNPLWAQRVPRINPDAARTVPPAIQPTAQAPNLSQVSPSISLRYKCNVMVTPAPVKANEPKPTPFLNSFTLEKQPNGKYAAMGEKSTFSQVYFTATKVGPTIEFRATSAREDYVPVPNEIQASWVSPMVFNTQTGIVSGGFAMYWFGSTYKGSCKVIA